MLFYIAKCTFFVQIVHSRAVSSKNRVFPRRIWNSLWVVMVLFFSAENFKFILSLSCDMQNSRGNFSELYEMQYNKYIADWLFRRVHFPYLEKHYSQACFCVITPQDCYCRIGLLIRKSILLYHVVSCFVVFLCVTSRRAFRCMLC